MKFKPLFIGAICFPGICFSLEVQPWFSDVYEFHWMLSYQYSHFHEVQGAQQQLTNSFHCNLLDTALEFCPVSEWSIDGDLQVAKTTQMPFDFRSGALQIRYLWFDDIVGDPITFATGANFCITNRASLHDVSCLSRSIADFEVNFAFGKELDVSDSWRCRLWCHGALGQGIVGSPWVKANVALESNIEEKHRLGIYAFGSNGYGRHSHVDLEHFKGYGKIRQKSIDMGIRYGYRMGVWGTLRFDYQRRVLAKACPQNVNAYAITYLLAFSF